MNKAKRTVRAKRKAKARRCGTYRPTKYKLGQVNAPKDLTITIPTPNVESNVA